MDNLVWGIASSPKGAKAAHQSHPASRPLADIVGRVAGMLGISGRLPLESVAGMGLNTQSTTARHDR
ncbi:MAG: hypothetical protein KDI48_17310 [Xanthomonadales bacterium]|nr:hypothetical protein [Xanthomonadales bacterium]